MLTLSPGPSPFSSTGSLLRKSFDPNAVTVFNPQTATQPSVSCPLSSSLIPTVCGGLDDRHVQECVETTPTTAAPNARGGKNAPGASTTRQASAQQHQSSIFPGGGGLLSRPASPSRRWKTIAITAMFTGQGVVAAGYEDGAVKISRLTTEDGPNGSAATPDTLAITRSSCGTTDRLVASAADERSRVSPSSAQQPTRSSNSTNFTRAELTEGATGIKTLESTAPLSKTSRELLAAVKNAESPTAMVTSVHCVPFGANHVGLAVAYSNCVFVSLEASSLVPNTMVLQRRHIVRTRVEISSKIILESLTRPDPSHAQAAAPTGRSASRTRVPSAGASPSADKLLNAPVQVDGVLLSPCLRFVAVSVCAPQLEVLVFPLPELMTETKLTAADRPGSSHTGNEVEKRTVPPARLLAHCMYENNTKVYNSKVEAATREVPQSAISPKGSAASEAARAAREKEAKEAEKKPDAVRSKCFFLSSRADVPCSGYERRRPNPTGMLVVVWLNSYSYARIPLKESPSTFLPQLRNVAKVEAAALAAATETQVVKRKGKGGAAVKDPSPRGKRGSSAGRKGKASPHPEPPMDLPVPLFSGVLRSSSASKIEMATHTDDGSFVVLGFVGGTVQLLHSRLSLDVLSAVPPPTGSPNLGQNVTHISALHAVTHYNIDSGEADCVSLVVGTHSVTESSGEIRPVTLAPGESSPPHPECTTPVEVHFGAAFVNFAIPSHMLEHPPAPGSQVESIHAGPISARYLVGLPSRVVTAVCLRPLPFAVLFLNPQHSELISAFSLHSLALPGNSATTVLWDAALGKVLGTLPLNLMGVEGRNRSARESRASSPVLTPTAVPPARAAPVPVVLAEQCLSTSTSGGLYWIEEHLPNQPSLWQSRPASPMELRLGSPPMEPPPPSTIFPVLWPISAMLQSLYPVLHSYFPHATLAAAGVMLHLLTPAQRRDPVAVGAMDHAMIPGMNGIEHNPQEERREMLGERRSRGASSRRPTSKMSAPRQSRAMRSSPNFLHMTTACDAATLCCHNAESFGCAWLGSTSNTTEPRAMDLARVLDDLQRRA